MATNGTTLSNGTSLRNGAPPAKATKHLNGSENIRTSEENIEDFLSKIMNMALEEGFKGLSRKSPVVRFKDPQDLRQTLDLELRDDAEPHERLLERCREVFKYSVKTGHPRFFNQLYGGLDPYGFAGQVITDVLNTSIYTYEVAPVFVLMEKVLLEHMMNIIGYTAGDGTFCPGGSYSNLMGMHLARFWKFPDMKDKGLRGLPRMVAFTSEHGHYSIKKNASLMGMPGDDVVPIKCDEKGKMCAKDLELSIVQMQKQGAVPFFVNSSAATTVLGAFDYFEDIADICKKYGMWMHVDASWGGSVMLSPKYKHLCQGIHRADSVAWNQHKMMMAPLQCSSFFTKHTNILQSCNGISVPYLFQTDKTTYDASYDIGSKILQCGRRVDSFKLWLMWKAKGNDGIARQIEKAFDNAQYLTEEIKRRSGFELVIEKPECTNVCFWYIPPRLRSKSHENQDEVAYKRELAVVAPVIKERMAARGTMLVGYQPLGDKPNFFRMVLINDKTERSDMDFVLDEIEQLGCDL